MNKLLTLIIAVLLTIALVGGGTVVAGTTSVTSEIEATVFGPETYLRTKEADNVYVDEFSVRGDYDGTVTMGKLIVINGDGGPKSTRVTDATVQLNGNEVLGSKDFKHKFDTMEIPVKLKQDNEIVVVISGKPGSYLTIQVDYETGPTGPIWSGPHQYPFVPRTEQSGLGQPLVDNHDTGIPI